MKIGVNKFNQIKQIRNITNVSLTIIELDETEISYPFKGWSDTRILSYCYKQTEKGISIYPYIDTNTIEQLEKQEDQMLKLQQIIDTMLTGGVIE